MDTTIDMSEAAFWRSVNPGSTVTVKDLQILQDLMKKGGDISAGVDFEVARVTKVSLGSQELLIFALESEDEALFLMVKIVDDDMEISKEMGNLRVYFNPDGIEFGTREALLDQKHFWLFQQPRDPENFVPAELEFANDFTQDVPEHDGDECKFIMKPLGVMYGQSVEVTKSGTSDSVFTAAVEYATEDDRHPNSEVIVLEQGGVEMGEYREDAPEDDSRGGFMSVFQGCNIGTNDLEVLRI